MFPGAECGVAGPLGGSAGRRLRRGLEVCRRLEVLAAEAGALLRLAVLAAGAGACRRRLVWAALLAGCCAGLFAGTVGWAQGPADAALRGELRDERGVSLGGAEVRLEPVEGGPSLVGSTGRQGEFGFLGAVPGVYRVSVRPRMAPVWVGEAPVELGAGEDAELALRLRVGARLDVVGVGGVETSASGQPVGDRVGSGKANGHEVSADLVFGGVAGEAGWASVAEVLSAARDSVLAGGGSAQDADEGEDAASAREELDAGMGSGSGLSPDGLPVVGSEATAEGLSAVQGFGGGPRAGAMGGVRLTTGFAAGAVGRMSAGVRSFSAQTGGAGGQVAGATGGEAAGLAWRLASKKVRLHGSGFFQAREAAWDAVNPFAVATSYNPNGAATGVGTALVRPADSDVRFGAAMSGSVRVPGLAERWRLGLFGSAEGRERRQVLFSSPETTGFFVLSAGQKALLANRGVGSAATAAALEYLSGLTGPETLQGEQWVGLGRADLAPTARDRLSLGYQALRSGQPTTAGAQVAEGVTSRAVGSVGVSSVVGDAGTLRWAHTFGPRWTNEVRAQVVRDLAAELPGGGSAAFPGMGPGGLAPQVSIAPQGFSYGTPAALGRMAYPDERRVEVADTAAWRFGRHLVTLGGNWSRLDDRVLGATNLEGSFLYDSGTTGGHAGGLVDWISDYTFNVHAYPNGACPSVTASVHYFCFRSYSQSFANAEAEFVTHEVAGFAEDALRLGPGLRVTLGARWEYQLLPFPLLPNATLDGALAGVGASGTGPSEYGSTASFPEDRNNVGPRIAVSWSPGVGRGLERGRGRGGAWFTVQAGYGMFFGRLPGATLDAALTQTGMAQSTTSIRITPTVETDCPQVANQGFGYPCAFEYAPLGVAPVASTASVVVFAKRFRLPAVQRGRLGIERGIGRRVTVRGEYAGAWAVQLPETTDLNVAPSTATVSYVVQGGDQRPGLWTGQSFQVPLYTARRTAKFGPVTSLESNANATYHSGTAEAVMRPWHGWGGRGSFTFSRALDYGPQVGATPRQDGQFDPFTDGYDKGRSSLDRPWGAAGEVTYRSSWESGGEWGRRLLGGWGMSAVGRAGSGAPYSYVIFGGTRLAGGHESVNGSGGATYLPTVGRNTLRLPMRSKVDLRAGKEVGLGRGMRLQVRADAFNLLNTVSVSRVETRAFLLGTAGSVGGMTPLMFQDATAVASEGVSTPAFGTALSSTTGLSRERTMEFGVRLSF